MPVLTPEQAAEMDVASKAMQDAAKAELAAKTPPGTPDKGGSLFPDALPDKVGTESPDSVSGAGEAPADKGETPPDEPNPLDPAFLPEPIRSKVHFDDEETAAVLRATIDGGRAEATQRFQEAKRLKAEAEADKRDAENFRVLYNHPKAREIIEAAMDNPSGAPKPADEPLPEIDPLDPQTIVAHMEAREARAAKRVRQEILSELNRPNELKEAVTGALEAYATENSIEPEVMLEAVKIVDASLAKRGKKWNPETVDVLMGPAVDLARLKKSAPVAPPVNKAPAVNGNGGLKSVASPVGRGGPHTAHVIPLPAHFVNGNPPNRPLTDDEVEQEGLFGMRKRFGPNVTLEDYRRGTIR